MVVQAALAIKRTFHAIYELWGFSKTKINCKDLFLINQWKLHLGSQQISKTIKKEKKKKKIQQRLRLNQTLECLASSSLETEALPLPFILASDAQASNLK